MLLQEMGARNKMNGSLPGWVNEDTGAHARCWTRRSTVLKLCVCACESVCVSAIHSSWGQQFSSRARRERRARQGRGHDWGLRTCTCRFTWTIDAIKRNFLQISVTLYMHMFAISDVSRLWSILENVYLLRADRTKFDLIILLSANRLADNNKCITIKYVCNKH